MDQSKLLVNGPRDAAHTLVLAHGAGAPMDSDFMNELAELMAERGIRVIRFEFPYMWARRNGGKKRPPDRMPILFETWRSVVDLLGGGASLFIGGKSMGGRVASMVADQLSARGLICLGYPFHPPGKPEKLRVAHLAELRTPALILQGTRDPFGTKAEVPSYTLSACIRIHWLEDGDHSFKPRVKSGRTMGQNIEEAAEVAAHFMREHTSTA